MHGSPEDEIPSGGLTFLIWQLGRASFGMLVFWVSKRHGKPPTVGNLLLTRLSFCVRVWFIVWPSGRKACRMAWLTITHLATQG